MCIVRLARPVEQMEISINERRSKGTMCVKLKHEEPHYVPRLTGAGLLSVAAFLFFQRRLLQVIIQGAQQVVHVALVSPQHQLCHASERLKDEKRTRQ